MAVDMAPMLDGFQSRVRVQSLSHGRDGDLQCYAGYLSSELQVITLRLSLAVLTSVDVSYVSYVDRVATNNRLQVHHHVCD